MADILIRGMDMPKNCMVCDFRNRGFDLNGDLFCNCRITKENVPDYYNIRMEDCPLHELPEHGDLIDRDYIQRTLKPYSKEDEQVEVTLGTAKRLIQNAINAPVIVPSNKEETE